MAAALARTRTTVLLNLAAIVERADEQARSHLHPYCQRECLQNDTYLAQDMPGALWMHVLPAGSSSGVSVHWALAPCHPCPIGHAHPLQGHGSGALPGIPCNLTATADLANVCSSV